MKREEKDGPGVSTREIPMWAAEQEPLALRTGAQETEEPRRETGSREGQPREECERGRAARHQVRQGVRESPDLVTETAGDSRADQGGGGASGEECGHQYRLEVSSPPDPRHNMAGKRLWNS